MQIIVITDDSWQATQHSPIVSDSVYNGETYDARLEQPGWDQPNFTPPPTGAWTAANIVTCFTPTLTPIGIPGAKWR